MIFQSGQDGEVQANELRGIIFIYEGLFYHSFGVMLLVDGRVIRLQVLSDVRCCLLGTKELP